MTITLITLGCFGLFVTIGWWLEARNSRIAQDDRFPRLRYGMPPTYVVARDPEQGKILIGGLGAMGVGQMWVDESEADQTREGYADAPHWKWPGNWWEKA